MKRIGDETIRITTLLRIWNGIREKLSLESLEYFVQVEKDELYAGWLREEIARRKIRDEL